MNADQINILLQRLDQILFLLQTICIASCFLCGFVSMQFLIHCKNQKHFF